MKNLFKHLCLIAIFIILSASFSMARYWTFEWNANTGPLDEYRLYMSSNSGDYIFGGGNHVIEIPAGTETVEIYVGTDSGLWYFVLTAYLGAAAVPESGPSNEVTVDERPLTPHNPADLDCFIAASGG